MRLQGLGAAEVVEAVRKVLGSFEAELKRGSPITHRKSAQDDVSPAPIGISE
jgi:hypothetical protein